MDEKWSVFEQNKYDPYQTRLTVGGNLIDYPGKLITPTADMLTSKLLFNITISTLGTLFMAVSLKNFYLNTPMDEYEYMWLPIDIKP